MRVLDFYIRLIFPLTFSLLEIYIRGNPEYEINLKKRDISTKDLTPSDFFPSIERVIFHNLVTNKLSKFYYL
jgi:hypothetical protein